MDKLVDELVLKTERLISQLPDVDYEAMFAFVEDRERIVQMMHRQRDAGHALSSEQQQRLRLTQQHDAAIVAHMESLKQEAGDWLRKYNQAKIQRQAYAGESYAEGMFYDRRK